MPMPPCIWTISLETRWKVSPILALARRDQLRHVGAVGVDGGQRRFDRRARQFQVGEHLGRAVLQGLEGADHLAELHADLQVVERGLEGLQRRSPASRRRRRRGRGRAPCRSGAAPARQRLGGRAVEARCWRRRGCRPATGLCAVTPASSALHQDRGRSPSGALGRRRSSTSAAMPSSTKVFLPVILPPLNGRRRPCPALWCGPSSMASAPTAVALGDLRQPLRLLRVRAAQDQGAGRGQARGQQRRGGQRAAELFQDQAEAQVAEVGAAVFLGDDHARPSPSPPSRSRRRRRSPARRRYRASCGRR